jgi:sugar O-acyltransferase (sialic acid O-acetyltransferase NeuD family)
MDRIVILGAGGLGREILDVIEAINIVESNYEVAGFLDDREPKSHLLEDRGVRYLGALDQLGAVDALFVIGIGDGVARRRVALAAELVGSSAPALIHPTATRGARVSVGYGTVICSHVSITTNIEIGRHVSLNLNCTVGHDAVLEDFVTVMPGATVSGDVHLGEACMVGTNAAIIQGVRVGREVQVGAGAAVIRDLPDFVTAVGVPAKIIGTKGSSN